MDRGSEAPCERCGEPGLLQRYRGRQICSACRADYAERVLQARERFQERQVYLARCGVLIKVGCSYQVEQRLRLLAYEMGAPVELLAALPGGMAAEKAIQRWLASERVGGEWFRWGPRARQMLRWFRQAGTATQIADTLGQRRCLWQEAAVVAFEPRRRKRGSSQAAQVAG